MTGDINAAPDYGDEPPSACSSRVFLGRDSFACGGTPGHGGKHGYRLPWVTIEWDGRAERVADAAPAAPEPAPLPNGIALAALECIRQEYDPGTMAHETALRALDDTEAARAGQQPAPDPDALLRNIDGLHDLVRDMLQALPDTADEQEWRDRAGALHVCGPDGMPYRAYTEEDMWKA